MHAYLALFCILIALLCVFKGRVCKGLLSECRGFVRVCKGLLSECRGFVRVCKGLLRVYKGLLSVYWAVLACI